MSDEYRDYLDELRSEVEKKAKRANQRLRQLEMSGITESSRAYQVTAKSVYDGMPGYVQTSAGNIAFDRSVKNKTIQELEQELENLDKFLEAKTSKARGYKQQLEKSYYGYLESQGELDEERSDEKGKPVPVEGGTSFKEWQQLFASEGSKTFGYQVVRGLQKTARKVQGKVRQTVEQIVNEALEKGMQEQQATGRALGLKNLAAYILEKAAYATGIPQKIEKQQKEREKKETARLKKPFKSSTKMPGSKKRKGKGKSQKKRRK